MALTTSPDPAPPPNRFVPNGVAPTSAGALEGRVSSLLQRPISSARDLERWIYDWSEVATWVSGAWARTHIGFDLDTGDAAARARRIDFERYAVPEWKRHEDTLNQRFLGSPYREELPDTFVTCADCNAKTRANRSRSRRRMNSPFFRVCRMAW